MGDRVTVSQAVPSTSHRRSCKQRAERRPFLPGACPGLVTGIFGESLQPSRPSCPSGSILGCGCTDASRHRNRTEPRVRPDSPMGACTHTPPPEAQPQGQESVLRFTSGSVERHIQPRFPFLLTRVQTPRQGPRSVQPQGQEHDRAPAGMPTLRQTYRPLSSLHRPVHVCIVRHAGNTLREDVTLQPVPSRRQRHCDEPLPRSGGSRLA